MYSGKRRNFFQIHLTQPSLAGVTVVRFPFRFVHLLLFIRSGPEEQPARKGVLTPSRGPPLKREHQPHTHSLPLLPPSPYPLSPLPPSSPPSPSLPLSPSLRLSLPLSLPPSLPPSLSPSPPPSPHSPSLLLPFCSPPCSPERPSLRKRAWH